jgi:hypothetical protein
MIFETEQELKNKEKAIKAFVATFKGSFQKLDPNDVDYKIFDSKGGLIAYAEVSIRTRSLYNAYPLFVPAKKIVKLIDKRMPPVCIWACEDGLIYGKVDKLKGEIKYANLNAINNSFLNSELIVYYEKQKQLKYIRYV